MAKIWYNNLGGVLVNSLSSGVSSGQITIQLDNSAIPIGTGDSVSFTLVEVDSSGKEIGWEIVTAFPVGTVVLTSEPIWTVNVYRTGDSADWGVWPAGTRIENRVTADEVEYFYTPGPEGSDGIDGIDGEDGTSISVKGNIPTVANLPTTAVKGDMWFTSVDGNGWVSNGPGLWTDIGSMTGPEGPQGPVGPGSVVAGPQGDIGIQGPAGVDGEDGLQGNIGNTGLTGLTGDVGSQGIQGLQGLQGIQGIQGAQGDAGVDGTSLYLKGSVASFSNLPTGQAVGDLYITLDTDDGWVSDGANNWDNVGPIQGPEGQAGTPGIDGTQGIQGIQGPIGLTGADGIQGVIGVDGPEGPEGPEGPAGQDSVVAGPAGQDSVVAGPGGPPGSAGADGTKWFTGTGSPSGVVSAAVSDLYLDESSGDVYESGGTTVWTLATSIKGTPGTNGINGPQWFSGAGAPSSATGNTGDYYLDGVSGNIYIRLGGGWSLSGENIKGPVGDASTTAGPDGADGVDGDDGLGYSVSKVFRGKADNDPIIMTWVGNSNTGGFMTKEPNSALVANPNVLIWQADEVESHSCSWETADHTEANNIDIFVNSSGVTTGFQRMCGYIKGQRGSPALAAANEMQEIFGCTVYLILTYQGGAPSDLVHPGLTDGTFGTIAADGDSTYDFRGDYPDYATDGRGNNQWWFHSKAVNEALASIQAGTLGATAYNQDYVDFVGDTLGQGDALATAYAFPGPTYSSRTMEESENGYVEHMTAFVNAAEGTTPNPTDSFGTNAPTTVVIGSGSDSEGGWAKNQYTRWFSMNTPKGSEGGGGIKDAWDNFQGHSMYQQVARNIYRTIAVPDGRKIPFIDNANQSLGQDESVYGTQDHVHPNTISNLAIGAYAARTCVELSNSAPRLQDSSGEILTLNNTFSGTTNTFTGAIVANEITASSQATFDGAGEKEIDFNNTVSTGTAKIKHDATGSGRYVFYPALQLNNSQYFVMNSDGSFETTGNIISGGSIEADGDIVAFSSSDKNLKDNLTLITNALEKVDCLSGNTFEWNEQSDKTGSDTGVVAQEVEALGLPGLTTTRANGVKAVAYEKLIPLLIEAVKELKQEIEELKK